MGISHNRVTNYRLRNMTMGDYASKGVAGSGLGLGIAGTALGVLNSANNGNGLLGGLFGGGNGGANVVSQLQSENAMLRAENYSDKNAKEVYMQSLNDNRRIIDAYIKPLSDEAANNRVEIATLRAEQKCCCEKQELREQILVGKINEVALTTKGKFDVLDQTIACLAGNVRDNARAIHEITETIIPASKICPEVMPRYNSFTLPKDPQATRDK